MNPHPFKKIIDEHERLLVAVLLLLGFTLRLAALDMLPLGLNQDEASAGYDAWALLNYGMDRCGNEWPVLLTAWGSGQNALMSYLAMPFIAMLGLSELSLRLTNAVFGCAALVIFWLLARRARGRGFGLCALFVLTICPWHIMASRWALESNLLPFFLLLGVYCTSAARDKPWALLGAGASFGLSLYAYGTAFFFLPLFLVFAFFWLRRWLRPASFFVAFFLFVLLALPITLCQALNALGQEGMTLFGLTLPQLTEGRQAATSVFGGGGFQQALENFRSFLRILWTQSDGLPYNALPYFGLFYFTGLPLAVLGLIVSLGTRKDWPLEAPMRLSLFAGLLCAFFITPNINRMNMVWLPVVYFSAVGLYVILCKLNGWSIVPIAAFLAALVLFVNGYRNTLKLQGSDLYFPGLGPAIEYVEMQSPGSVYVSNYVNQPYIFALFYSETPPQQFVTSVDYVNPNGAFRQVRSFAHFRFGPASEAEGDYLILHWSEAEGYETVESFGNYVVCKTR